MDIIALKLVLTPVLIGVASLAARRWGPAISGWLVGLPFTSGPVAFFVALNHGTGFAASVAAGTLIGTVSQAAYCLSYAWLAETAIWLLSLAAGCIAFGATTILLENVSLSLPVTFVSVVAALGVALRMMPRAGDTRDNVAPPPWWDIPARMLVATVFVLALTGAAPLLGARLTGLLAPFPLYATILTVFAHHLQGSAAAIQVLRGLLIGLFAFATFFVVLAASLERIGIGPAFLASIAAALTLQAGSLWVLRRGTAHDTVDGRAS
jgi:hypothetical protein